MDPLSALQNYIGTSQLRINQRWERYLTGKSILVNQPKGSRLCKLSGDGRRFKVKTNTGMQLKLLSQKNSAICLYTIVIGDTSNIDGLNGDCARESTPQIFRINEWQEFWLRCNNEVIQIGSPRQKPSIQLNRIIRNDEVDIVGYIEFFTEHRNHPVRWMFEESPVDLTPVKHRKIEGGELTWVRMTSGDPIPLDAMIGGFDEEPTYIIRATHNGSCCPGKYVPSLKAAFVSWGRREHRKTDFEMLCGFNASWVWTQDANIPENAFIAGTSEVRDEPLYIGRAIHNGYVVNGKVHTLYSLCYLPFKGKEIEAGVYEILVQPDRESELISMWG